MGRSSKYPDQFRKDGRFVRSPEIDTWLETFRIDPTNSEMIERLP